MSQGGFPASSQLESAPMYYPPAPFDLDLARQCNAKVNVAYAMYEAWLKQGNPHQKDFDWKPPEGSGEYLAPLWGTDTVFHFFHHAEPFALVSREESGDVFMAFRGTESPEDWVEDADDDQKPYCFAEGYGRVSHGFHIIYSSMSKSVRAALAVFPEAKRLFVTGHSLGSSLSTLAVPDIITNTEFKPSRIPVTHYSFASPRTGDPAFATAFLRNGVPSWRIVNSCDLVPELPPSILLSKSHIYEHVGVPVLFSAQYGSIGGNHSNARAYGYALAHPDQPQGPVATG